MAYLFNADIITRFFTLIHTLSGTYLEDALPHQYIYIYEYKYYSEVIKKWSKSLF